MRQRADRREPPVRALPSLTPKGQVGLAQRVQRAEPVVPVDRERRRERAERVAAGRAATAGLRGEARAPVPAAARDRAPEEWAAPAERRTRAATHRSTPDRIPASAGVPGLRARAEPAAW